MGNIRTTNILLLILCFAVVFFPQIRVVRAQGTIYIRSDGNVEGTDKLQRDGNIYTFLGNISIDGSGTDGIIVERDNIMIDGVNHLLQGNETGVGINLANRSKVIIRNLEIRDFNAGIGIYDSQDNTIVGNLLVNNLAAVSITDSDNNSITENTIMDNENGVFLFSSYNNSVYGNNFINNTQQVYDNVWNNPWLPQLLSVNFWDNSTIGNYWSDYNGTDADSDGIGDTPYIINEENQDNYPLVEPTVIPEFPSWAILPLVLAITLFSILVKRKLYNAKVS